MGNADAAVGEAPDEVTAGSGDEEQRDEEDELLPQGAEEKQEQLEEPQQDEQPSHLQRWDGGGGGGGGGGGEKRGLNIAFLHLDLGIGGAEQLVVNAAVAALQRGHRVRIYTTHHDPAHCFEETTKGGILADKVVVCGDWLPRTVLGKCTALCAALRMLYLSALLLLRILWHGAGSETVTETVAGEGPLLFGPVDAIVLDGVSAPMPLLRLTGAPVLFYCHFPDKLLCTKRGGALKRMYRFPLDLMEELTTLLAHKIAVNSNFTRQTTVDAFSLCSRQDGEAEGLAARVARLLGLPQHSLSVLYPPINLDSFAVRESVKEGGEPPSPERNGSAAAGQHNERTHAPEHNGNTSTHVSAVDASAADTAAGAGAADPGGDEDADPGSDGDASPPSPPPSRFPSTPSAAAAGSVAANGLGPFVSINRFERKKNVMLAVEALRVLKDTMLEQAPSTPFEAVQLVIAGGCDSSVPENIEYKAELEERVSALGLVGNVTFRPNVSDQERAELLCSAACVLYTPDKEHFGIVPLEAMYAGAPVVCVASGGPLETVKDNKTGFLCDQTPEAFGLAMLRFVRCPSLTRAMGREGHEHVRDNFSLLAFAQSLDGLLTDMVQRHGAAQERRLWRGLPAWGLGMAFVGGALASHCFPLLPSA